MSIRNDGRVGIGTTKPSAILDISGPTTPYPNNKALRISANGKSNFKDQIAITSNLAAPDKYGIAFAGRGHHRGGIWAENAAGSNGNIGIWARSNGSIFLEANTVGVGTRYPTAVLSIGNPQKNEAAAVGKKGGTQLRISGMYNKGVNLGGKKLFIDNYDNDGSTVYPIYLQDENGKVDFWIKNRNYPKRKDTIAYFGGSIGIGVSDPSEKLEVKGNIKLSGNIVSDGDICIGNCGNAISAQSAEDFEKPEEDDFEEIPEEKFEEEGETDEELFSEEIAGPGEFPEISDEKVQNIEETIITEVKTENTDEVSVKEEESKTVTEENAKEKTLETGDETAAQTTTETKDSEEKVKTEETTETISE